MEHAEHYRVAGAVFNQADKRPLINCHVKAFDKDFFREQPLGEAVTDGSGHYEIQFDRDDFTGPLIRLERHPDVFVTIYDETGHFLKSTGKSVIIDAGMDTRIDVGVKLRRPTPTGPELGHLHGEPVNLLAVSRLTRDDLLDAYQFWRRPNYKAKHAELIKEAFPTLGMLRDPDDDCGEGFGETIRQLLRERGDFDSIDELDLDNFPAGVTVKSFFTDNVVVKYTTDTGAEDQVDSTTPGSDQTFSVFGLDYGTLRANLADLHADNTELAPTYIQKVGLIAEYALSQWIGAPFSFRDPRNGAARMEYRILKQSAGIAGQTNGSWSHVEVDVDNGDAQNSFTVSHELFHQIQYRYNNTTTRSGIYGILREGGARFAVESINDEPNRYVESAKAIFDGPDESLINVVTGVKNPIRYAAGLFWKYIAEKHSTMVGAANEPAIGVDTYRALLEDSATVATEDPGIGYVMDAIRNARQRLPWYGRFDRFGYYDTAKEELGSHETTWGNYLIANYLHGTANPVPDSVGGYPSRFDYVEDEDPVTLGGATVAKLAELQSSIATNDNLIVGQGASLSRTISGLNPWAARYYRITPSAASTPRMVRLTFTASTTLSDPLFHVLRLGSDESLLDIHRSDTATYSKTINMAGIGSLIVIVASRDNGGDCTLAVEETPSDTDVMVSRWNSRVATEYEINPAGWSWHWVSPDIMVDTDDDGAADTEVFFDQNNTLKIRLRNRGNVPASNITVDFWYQKATPYLSASAWIPVTNTAGAIQQVTGGSLAAQGDAAGDDEQWFAVDWAPANDGTDHQHWCVKAKITVPGDPNSDNKVVLSNFSNVTVAPDSDVRQLLRLPDGLSRHELQIVARGRRWNLKVKNDTIRPAKGKARAQCRSLNDVAALPTQVEFATLGITTAKKLKQWDPQRRAASPDATYFYPTDPESLPPGVDPSQLVTLVEKIDNEAIGGVSYRVIPKE